MKRGKRINQRSAKRVRQDEAMAQLRAWRFRQDGDCVARHLWAETGVRCSGSHELDHIIPVGLRRDLRLDPRNVHRLCDAHHDWKHAEPDAARALDLRRDSHEDPPPLPPGWAPPPAHLLWAIADATTSTDEARQHTYGELLRDLGLIVKREPGDDSPHLPCGYEPR